MSNGKITKENAASLVGQELGVSNWIQIDQGRINAFADCTGDHQWIHIDVERAKKESPYGTTIAHGFLTLSLLAPTAGEVWGERCDWTAAINYGADKVRFINAVKVGARVRNRIKLLGVEDKGHNRLLLTTENTMEIDGEDKPALIAQGLTLGFFR